MPIVMRCPMCGYAGESRDRDEVFRSATMTDGKTQVRRCRACAATFFREPRFFGLVGRWRYEVGSSAGDSRERERYTEPVERPQPSEDSAKADDRAGFRSWSRWKRRYVGGRRRTADVRATFAK